MESKPTNETMVTLPLETVRELEQVLDEALDAIRDGMVGTAVLAIGAVWRELDAARTQAEAHDEQ